MQFTYLELNLVTYKADFQHSLNVFQENVSLISQKT